MIRADFFSKIISLEIEILFLFKTSYPNSLSKISSSNLEVFNFFEESFRLNITHTNLSSRILKKE